jgi:hypothetical protein
MRAKGGKIQGEVKMTYILFEYIEEIDAYDFVKRFNSVDDATDYAYSEGVETFFIQEVNQ